MITLFRKLCLQSDPIVRNHPIFVGPSYSDSIAPPFEGRVRVHGSDSGYPVTSRMPLPFHTRTRGWRAQAPLWFRVNKNPISSALPGSQIYIQDPDTGDKAVLTYGFSRWIPYAIRRSQLPFVLSFSGAALLRSPDRRPGLLDAVGRGARIRELGFPEALTYGYHLDSRFILLVCLLLGFSLYCSVVPRIFLEAPEVICSPDLGELIKVGKDTYFNHICTAHGTPSPCSCGEPLNKALPILLNSKELPFDPLGAGVKSRAAGVAVFLGAVVLSLALSESVCVVGFSAV